MDPNDILALVAGAGGGVAIIGAGLWAFLRGRGGKQSGSEEQSSTQSPGEEPRGGTVTAVKERPAKPTWSDTLSAPSSTAAPAQDVEASVPVHGQERPAEPVATEETTGAPTDRVDHADGQAAKSAAPVDAAPAQTAPAEPALVDAAPAAPAPAAPVLDAPEPAASRMQRLRERLSRSGALGRGLLTLLTSGKVDEATWDEIEETLLMADLGPDATDELMDNLRRRMQVLNTDDVTAVREALREELVSLVNPGMDRRLAASTRTAPDGTTVPSVILMVGVNGTGKTTTVGKLARVLVAEGRTCVLGAADTFRAAAADQLATWGSRVGVDTVRSDRDGADPAAVAFDAVKEGRAQGVDVVLIDTAGRLQNKKGLMDELGKVRRVAEKGLHGDEIAEVLLVLDATTGQNGMQQARVFQEAVNITGIVLTKLDGTAKGGIVVNVQRELGVPVKMVGLGEGMDDLAPFDPHGFVDALLGE